MVVRRARVRAPRAPGGARRRSGHAGRSSRRSRASGSPAPSSAGSRSSRPGCRRRSAGPPRDCSRRAPGWPRSSVRSSAERSPARVGIPGMFAASAAIALVGAIVLGYAVLGPRRDRLRRPSAAAGTVGGRREATPPRRPRRVERSVEAAASLGHLEDPVDEQVLPDAAP